MSKVKEKITKKWLLCDFAIMFSGTIRNYSGIEVKIIYSILILGIFFYHHSNYRDYDFIFRGSEAIKITYF